MKEQSRRKKASGAVPMVVLAVSQPVTGPDPKVPRTEFETLSNIMDAVIVGNTHICRRTSVLEKISSKIALDFAQAIRILQNFPGVDAYISFSERIGIPLGMLLRNKRRRPAHVMIAHRLDTRAKQLLNIFTRWRYGVDRIITLCATQERHAGRILPGAAKFIKAGSTDNQYYYPSETQQGDYILSVGSENRDYSTLLAAIPETGLKLKILSSSPWCRKEVTSRDNSCENVEFLPRVSYPDLRDLYRKAKLIALPLNDVEYAAGLNGLLEAFCMGKPLVVSSSSGLSDYISHLDNSFIVPAGNTAALADALQAVYSDESLRLQLSAGAKAAVEDYANLAAFTSSLEREIKDTISEV